MITRLLVACPVDTFLTSQGAQASVFSSNPWSRTWRLNGSDCVHNENQPENRGREVERFVGDNAVDVRGPREAKKQIITGTNEAIEVLSANAKGRSFCA
jgi:hypothetical protein